MIGAVSGFSSGLSCFILWSIVRGITSADFVSTDSCLLCLLWNVLITRLPSFFTTLQANLDAGSLERRWCPLEEGSQGSFKGSTALLFELEDKVAQAAADVQSAQSEVRTQGQKLSWVCSEETDVMDLCSSCLQVSYIENRIAALSAVSATGDTRRKVRVFYFLLLF